MFNFPALMHSASRPNPGVINLRLYCSALLRWKATVATMTALPDLLLFLPLSLFLLLFQTLTFWVLNVPDQRPLSAGENSSRGRRTVLCRRPPALFVAVIRFFCAGVLVPRSLKHHNPESLCSSAEKHAAVCLSRIQFGTNDKNIHGYILERNISV